MRRPRVEMEIQSETNPHVARRSKVGTEACNLLGKMIKRWDRGSVRKSLTNYSITNWGIIREGRKQTLEDLQYFYLFVF